MKFPILLIILICFSAYSENSQDYITSESYKQFDTGLKSTIQDRTLFYVLKSLRTKNKLFQKEIENEIKELENILFNSLYEYFDKVDSKERFNPKNKVHVTINALLIYFETYQPKWIEESNSEYVLRSAVGAAKKQMLSSARQNWAVTLEKIKNWKK